jgi:hypothetical protein
VFGEGLREIRRAIHRVRGDEQNSGQKEEASKEEDTSENKTKQGKEVMRK